MDLGVADQVTHGWGGSEGSWSQGGVCRCGG